MNRTDELQSNSPIGSGREQAVIICLQFPMGKLQQQKALDAIFELDEILREVVETADVGIYDGHEFCESEEEESVTFYLYGEDANKIYYEIKPVLQSLSSLQEVSIIKRYSNFQHDHISMTS